MTASSNTLYTLMLFLALAVLNLWIERRGRSPGTQTGRQSLRLRMRAHISTFLIVENAAVRWPPAIIGEGKRAPGGAPHQ
jgi:hypothetical protein